MLKFEKQIEKIVQALELQRVPVGARFSETPASRAVNRELRICEAFDVALKENAIVNLSKEKCTCRGGRHMAGWQSLPPGELPEIYMSVRAYESKEIAEASVSKQPQLTYRGKFLILGPLSKFEADPDVVSFFVNPSQADRILGLASYKGAELFTLYPVSSLCSTITFALAEGKPNVNLISTFERRRGRWSQNELVVTLPFKAFSVAMESLRHSGYGSSPASE